MVHDSTHARRLSPCAVLSVVLVSALAGTAHAGPKPGASAPKSSKAAAAPAPPTRGNGASKPAAAAKLANGRPALVRHNTVKLNQPVVTSSASQRAATLPRTSGRLGTASSNRRSVPSETRSVGYSKLPAGYSKLPANSQYGQIPAARPSAGAAPSSGYSLMPLAPSTGGRLKRTERVRDGLTGRVRAARYGNIPGAKPATYDAAQNPKLRGYGPPPRAPSGAAGSRPAATGTGGYVKFPVGYQQVPVNSQYGQLPAKRAGSSSGYSKMPVAPAAGGGPAAGASTSQRLQRTQRVRGGLVDQVKSSRYGTIPSARPAAYDIPLRPQAKKRYDAPPLPPAHLTPKRASQPYARAPRKGTRKGTTAAPPSPPPLPTPRSPPPKPARTTTKVPKH